MSDKNTAPENGAIQNALNVEVVQTQLITVPANDQAPILFGEENRGQLIQAFINAEVIHFETSPEECAKILKSSAKLKVKDNEDEAGYKKVKEQYNKLVKIRTTTDAKRKDLGKPYSEITKGINAYATDNILSVLSGEEARLKAEKDKYEKWEQERKEKEAREAKEKLDKRVEEVKAAGLVFNGDFWAIGDVLSVDLVTLGKLSDSDFVALIAKVKAEKTRIDEEEKAERERKEEEERQAREQREENERKAKELRAEILEVRGDRLAVLGFTDDPDKERYYLIIDGLVEISYDDVAEKNKDDFNAYIKEISLRILNAPKPSSPAPDLEPKEAQEEAEAETVEPKYNTEDIEPDLASMRAYINSITKMPLPQLRTEAGNEILAAFKNNLKLSCDEVLKQIDPNHKTAE